MVHEAETFHADLLNCCHLRRFIVFGKLHINAHDVGVRAAGAPPDPRDHLVGLVWFAGADDLQRLLAVERNPFEGYGVLALLTGNVNDVEVAALVGRLATMTLALLLRLRASKRDVCGLFAEEMEAAMEVLGMRQ